MKNFLFSGNIIFAMICILTYIMSGLNPATYWLFSISSLLIPIFFIINILWILLWLILHWKYSFLSFGIIILGYPQLKLLLNFGESNSGGKCNSAVFSLMSYNVYGLKNLKDTLDNSHLANKTKFLSFIRQYQPDILCVQEDNLYADDVINKSDLYPYFHYLIQFGAAIYSKHPIIEKGVVDFGTKTNSCLWADILVHGKRMRVYSVHLQSNRVSKDVNKITDEQAEKNSERLNIFKRMLRNYRNSAVIRASQTQQILDHAQQAKVPVLIAGDFNDTPFSFAYEQITKKYKDSFIERGYGLGSTFVGALPGLRIDYVFAGIKHFDFCRHEVLQTTFSDHNPVFTKLYCRI
ncbi:MAG TPA: endonuclease/exonuclease/phosphatase family protein [Saprospiraceae bacterium]|nr:endonuclease/exonuclease/phosphatase family protein [Saprospiraceae bacterium]